MEYAGEIYVADITTPKFLEDDIPYELLLSESVDYILPPRYEDTHKGTYGHLFIIAGSPGKSGAAALSALHHLARQEGSRGRTVDAGVQHHRDPG